MVLPPSLCTLSALRELHAAYNRLVELQGPWAQLESLAVLDLEGNSLRSMPSDIGWLQLRQLNISVNPGMRRQE